MRVYPNVSAQDLGNLAKLADQQKNQRAELFENRIVKETHDERLAETSEPRTKKLTNLDDSTKTLRHVFKKPDSGDENTQTPSIQNVTGIEALRDTLSFMKRSKNFFELT